MSAHSQKRPRIASAANTVATMGFSGASHMVRDPSQVVSSQGEPTFTFSENQPNLMHKASASNYSQQEIESGLKTRYGNNRFIPDEAIEEEADP